MELVLIPKENLKKKYGIISINFIRHYLGDLTNGVRAKAAGFKLATTTSKYLAECEANASYRLGRSKATFWRKMENSS